jgi:hypothetical protein
MTKNSEITTGSSPAIARAAANLRLAANMGFWSQLVLGVVSGLILLFASTSLVGRTQTSQISQGSGFGIFCALGGVLALGVSIYFFLRYRKIAQLIQSPNPADRPKKGYTLQAVKTGIIVNLLGMLSSIIGAEAFVGIVLGKSLALPQGAAVYNTQQLVNSIDIFIILANTHTITSHFVGIVIALWLFNSLNK